MSLDTGRYQLYSALTNIQQMWHETVRKWNDDVRREFEETFWEPLQHDAKASLAGIDRLDQVLTQVKRECSA